MSHSVVITRTTTTTTSTSHVVLNTGYLRTTPGLLKLAQLIIGAVNVGLVAYYIRRYPVSSLPTSPEFFFLLMAVAFLIGTFCLLASCLVSLSTGGIISKTIYELIYHTIAFLLYLIASIILLVDVSNGRYWTTLKDAYMAASILGLIVSSLYLFSALLAQRSYRGI
ncbi:uncharacterized protein LOC126579818 [Anopheles aquasalis]|uniref:Putative member of chemokine-like factor super family n=1 Tax=Anopheles marajoara TaxID=58244 RepID=A0A2M4C1L1_9DIPT|nr:uncharacterized protein LOC126579818 [Anopheles aquasalis]